MNEIVKTQLTCGFCHHRVKFSNVAELPNELARKYDAVPPRAVSVYLDSEEGNRMINDFNRAWHADDFGRLTWKELKAMTAKFNLALEDIAYVTEGVWSDETRNNVFKYHLTRLLTNAITRKVGGCLFCGTSFSDLLPIQLMGVDFHHIMESKKKYDPSHRALFSPREAVFELRKTCPLCKLCHTKVTHSKSNLKKFMTRFDELGCKVNEMTGYVVKEEESKRGPRRFDLVDTDDEEE
jgi:hypothetical protein